MGPLQILSGEEKDKKEIKLSKNRGGGVKRTTSYWLFEITRCANCVRGGATSAQIQSSSSPPPPLPPPPPPPPSHSRLTHRCLFTASASASAARLTTWGGLLSADMLSGRWWCAEGAVNLAVGAGSRQARKQRPPPPAVSWCTRPTAAPVRRPSRAAQSESSLRPQAGRRVQEGYR